MVRFLLDAGADVNQRSMTEQTPLHQAVFYGHMPIVDLLLEYGADIKAGDVNGLQVVHYAVDCGRPEMLQHVLSRGADVHATDSNGWTPLFRAVVQGAATKIAEVLVEAGAEAAAVDRAGLALPAAARVLLARGSYGFNTYTR
ncbi:Fibronectin type 3 and ankyrin repeat domains 1 protein [Eumeta japonica]|uniref:Fibronectin type 3 and ankyrin repeat domains 1 protein n=1 Tax=Eumeta variegata TaxID=151549 RepID=A0A4C1Z0W0_EUMVA|nr:Fibronectin type 3 and ankyrin repeat domains 1 protein [Eumeta japonica]